MEPCCMLVDNATDAACNATGGNDSADTVHRLLRPYSANEGEFILLALLLGLFALVGSVGNIPVLLFFGQRGTGTGKERPVARLLVRLLAAFDLSVCLLLIPLTVVGERLNFVLQSSLLCSAFFALSASKIPLTSLMIALIALDRYLCICYPFRRLLTMGRVRAILLVLFASVIAMGIAAGLLYTASDELIAFADGSYVPQGSCMRRSQMALQISANSTVASTAYCDECLQIVNLSLFCAVFAIVTVCYWRIHVFTNRQRRRVMRPVSAAHSNAASPPENSMVTRSRAREHRMAVVFALLSAIYLVSVLPGILMASGFVQYVSFLFYLVYINSAVNPFIYFAMNKTFRAALLHRFCSRELFHPQGSLHVETGSTDV